MHALIRNAWGDAHGTVCISHMHASHSLPPLMLMSSWLRGFPPGDAPAKAGHCDGADAVARAAVRVLHTAVEDEEAQNDTEDSDGSDSSTSSSALPMLHMNIRYMNAQFTSLDILHPCLHPIFR